MDLPGPTAAQLAQHLEGLRNAAGLSVPEFAERAELSIERVIMLESGTIDQALDELRKYARGLGMTLGVVFRLWEQSRN